MGLAKSRQISLLHTDHMLWYASVACFAPSSLLEEQVLSLTNRCCVTACLLFVPLLCSVTFSHYIIPCNGALVKEGVYCVLPPSFDLSKKHENQRVCLIWEYQAMIAFMKYEKISLRASSQLCSSRVALFQTLLVFCCNFWSLWTACFKFSGRPTHHFARPDSKGSVPP